MEAGSSFGFEDSSRPVCDSCGRTPARTITVRRHVGLLVLQQFVSTRVSACRPCGRRLIRSYTGKTLWQGWWGVISFFFNWFVLAANAWAWSRLGALENPSLSGTLVADEPRGFDDVEQPAQAEVGDQPKRRSRLRRGAAFVVPGFFALGLLGWGWDATHHDHSEPHGAPDSAVIVEKAMTDGPFTSEDGTTSFVATASCAGEGEADPAGADMYTHFRCQVTFDDGTIDEVSVHLLEDQLFFKSTQS